jgi:hypothetical protein
MRESPTSSAGTDSDGFAGCAADRSKLAPVLRCGSGPEFACSALAEWVQGFAGLHFTSRLASLVAAASVANKVLRAVYLLGALH